MTIECGLTGSTNKLLCHQRTIFRGQRQGTVNTPCDCGLHTEGLTQRLKLLKSTVFLEVWLSPLSPQYTSWNCFDASSFRSGYISIWSLGGIGEGASKSNLLGIAPPMWVTLPWAPWLRNSLHVLSGTVLRTKHVFVRLFCKGQQEACAWLLPHLWAPLPLAGFDVGPFAVIDYHRECNSFPKPCKSF